MEGKCACIYISKNMSWNDFPLQLPYEDTATRQMFSCFASDHLYPVIECITTLNPG